MPFDPKQFEEWKSIASEADGSPAWMGRMERITLKAIPALIAEVERLKAELEQRPQVAAAPTKTERYHCRGCVESLMGMKIREEPCEGLPITRPIPPELKE